MHYGGLDLRMVWLVLPLLQAVQQMIAVQEQLLQQQRDGDTESPPPSAVSAGHTNMNNICQPSMVSETTAGSIEQNSSVSTTWPLRSEPRVGSFPPTASQQSTSDINTSTLAKVPPTSEESRAPTLGSAGSSPSSSILSLFPSNFSVQEPPNIEMTNGGCEHQQVDITAERSSTLLSLRSMKGRQQGLKSRSKEDLLSLQALQDQKQNQLQLLNKKIAQRRLQQMQPPGATSQSALRKRQHNPLTDTVENGHTSPTHIVSKTATQKRTALLSEVAADADAHWIASSPPPSTHMDEKLRSTVSSAPPTSVATVFHGLPRSEVSSVTSNPSLHTTTTLTSTHSLHSHPSTDSTVVTRMHPQTTTASDVSKHVRPSDYQLPGVPSYTATTQASTMTGGSIYPTRSYPLFSKDHQCLDQVNTGMVRSGAVDRDLSERYSTASVAYRSMGIPARSSTLDNSSGTFTP